jgi:hypothetical protein
MELRQGEQHHPLLLPPRSLLVMGGEARYAWCAAPWGCAALALCAGCRLTLGGGMAGMQGWQGVDASVDCAHRCWLYANCCGHGSVLCGLASAAVTAPHAAQPLCPPPCRQHYIPHRKADEVEGRVVARARRVSLTFRKVVARQGAPATQGFASCLLSL